MSRIGTDAVGAAAPAVEPGVEPAMRPAKQPVGSGAAPVVAQLVALGLVGLGAVGIQEAVVRSGLSTAPSWTGQAVAALDGRSAAAWIVVVGGVPIVLAVALLLVVLRPRPRTSLALASDTGVYLRARDLAAVATAAIGGLDGATELDVEASRRRLEVRVRSIAGSQARPDIERAVRTRLEPVLSALRHPPRVGIKVTGEESA